MCTKSHKISLNSSQSVVPVAARIYCNYCALKLRGSHSNTTFHVLAIKLGKVGLYKRGRSVRVRLGQRFLQLVLCKGELAIGTVDFFVLL